MAKEMTDDEYEEELRGCIGRCKVCADLHGLIHYVSVWDQNEH